MINVVKKPAFTRSAAVVRAHTGQTGLLLPLDPATGSPLLVPPVEFVTGTLLGFASND